MGVSESLNRRYDMHNSSNGEWRHTQHYFFLETISADLNLNRTDIQRILYITRRVGIKQLHKRASMEQVLLALAVFIKEESTGHPLRIDRYTILKEYNVNYKLYTTVLRNLLRYYRSRSPVVRG
jgi:hypothetical protein